MYIYIKRLYVSTYIILRKYGNLKKIARKGEVMNALEDYYMYINKN